MRQGSVTYPGSLGWEVTEPGLDPGAVCFHTALGKGRYPLPSLNSNPYGKVSLWKAAKPLVP